jgi:hypothetical protein
VAGADNVAKNSAPANGAAAAKAAPTRMPARKLIFDAFIGPATQSPQ